MKIRKGFVSNSSSSSFIILTDNISAKQLKKIYNHRIKTKPDDWWSIIEKDDYIQLSTFMDNFDMYTYLINIGVNEEDILQGR